MNKNFKGGSQGGFTLIELIVVIVILGILAATALPKFAGLSGDARAASLKAAKGALTSTSTMVHGKYLMNPAGGADGTALALENATVHYKYGYAAAETGLALAAGLGTDDYDASVSGTTLKIVPLSAKGTDAAANCYISYTEAASAGATPSVSIDVSKCE